MNRTPSKSLHFKRNTTPAELWYNAKPNIKKLKVFGSAAYSHISEHKRQKFDEKCKRLIMVGYCTNGCRLWDPNNQTIILERNVIFDERSNVFDKPLDLPQDIGFNKQEEVENEELTVEEKNAVENNAHLYIFYVYGL